MLIYDYEDKKFDGNYEIYNDGRVCSYKSNMFIKPFADGKRGYLKIKLYDIHGEPNTLSVHRLVASFYVKNPDMKKTVNHINGVITDNNASNLEWSTNNENVRHAIDNRVSTFRRKQLLLEEVHDICYYLFIKEYGPTYVSKLTGINKTTIDKIHQFKNHRSISEYYIKNVQRLSKPQM